MLAADIWEDARSSYEDVALMVRTALIRWTAWHNSSPIRAGGFVLLLSLGLSAAAYLVGAWAQREADRSS